VADVKGKKTPPFYKLDQVLAARTDMTPTDKLVFAVLLHRQNGKRDAWPHEDRIASDAGLSERTVRRSIKNLELFKLLEVRRGRWGNRYVVAAAIPDKLSGIEEVDTGQNVRSEPDKVSAVNRTKCPLPYMKRTKEKNKGKRPPSPSAPADSRIPEFITWFSGRFKAVRGSAYIVAWGRDGKLLKDLFKSGLSLDDLKARSNAMLAHEFWGSKASIPNLSAHVNEFLSGGASGSPVRLPAAPGKYAAFGGGRSHD